MRATHSAEFQKILKQSICEFIALTMNNKVEAKTFIIHNILKNSVKFTRRLDKKYNLTKTFFFNFGFKSGPKKQVTQKEARYTKILMELKLLSKKELSSKKAKIIF